MQYVVISGVGAVILLAVYSLYKVVKLKRGYKRKERELEKRQEELREIEEEIERKKIEARERASEGDREKSRLEELKKEVWRNQEWKNLREEQIRDLDVQLREIHSQIFESNKRVEELVQNERSIAEKRIEEEVKLIRQLQEEELKKELDQALEVIQADKKRMQEELDPLRKELLDFQAKRESIIEALKREQELREREDFYRIKLGEEAVSDISYLIGILSKLKNQKVVSELIFKHYIQGPAKEMLNRVVGLKKVCGIYRIADMGTQECYIGQGVDISTRLLQHIRGSLGIQTIADQRIHSAMREKGVQNWTFEVLEECDREDLTEREKYYIAHYKSNEFGFNRRLG